MPLAVTAPCSDTRKPRGKPAATPCGALLEPETPGTCRSCISKHVANKWYHPQWSSCDGNNIITDSPQGWAESHESPTSTRMHHQNPVWLPCWTGFGAHKKHDCTKRRIGSKGCKDNKGVINSIDMLIDTRRKTRSPSSQCSCDFVPCAQRLGEQNQSGRPSRRDSTWPSGYCTP